MYHLNLSDFFKVSDGGVHSHITHLFGLLKALKTLGVPHTYIHFYGDGRDTKPESGGIVLLYFLEFKSNKVFGFEGFYR